MQRFVDDIFAYYDSPLPIGSDEIIKRLQMWWNNPQCGHKEGQKFPIFLERYPSGRVLPYTDIATTRLKRPKGRFDENLCIHSAIKFKIS